MRWPHEKECKQWCHPFLGRQRNCSTYQRDKCKSPFTGVAQISFSTLPHVAWPSLGRTWCRPCEVVLPCSKCIREQTLHKLSSHCQLGCQWRRSHQMCKVPGRLESESCWMSWCLISRVPQTPCCEVPTEGLVEAKGEPSVEETFQEEWDA